MKKFTVAFAVFLFFVGYTLFWVKIFDKPKVKINPKFAVATESSSVSQQVLSAQNYVQPSPTETSFASLIIPLDTRRQAFNLSCEFAAAASIIEHFTQNPDFQSTNELRAEEMLMQQVGVSQNPNLGIRMGLSKGEFNSEDLYNNLNKKFGGSDYYGVHAPAFFDVFKKYGLTAQSIQKNNFIAQVQRAISANHLVMAWIRIGYGQPVDLELSYGSVPIIRGEHSVVINGYDESGVSVMDPGKGELRHISYEQLADAMTPFSMPLLEVYPALHPALTLEDVVRIGQAKGFTRKNVSIVVENNSRKVGKGSELAEILKDFGYSITAIRTVSSDEPLEGLSISIKDSFKDYLVVLTKDLEAANYTIATISANLSLESSSSAIITTGE